MSSLEAFSRAVIFALVVAHVALAALGQTQIPLQRISGSEGTKRAITQELSQFITDLMKSSGIPGISLGVVHTGGGDKPDIELKSWGRMSEEGGDLSPNVSTLCNSLS